jgi:hypothetical protein
VTSWMQTTGMSLLVLNRCSPWCVRTPAQDSHSAHGLLYLAAVRDHRREQEHRQGRVDTYSSLVGSFKLMEIKDS